MPQYELMYLLGSHVADSEVPTITQQVLKSIEDFGGTEIAETQLGKKKLAYPIKKTRNGYYVVVDFNMDSQKINDLDAKIRTQDATIIRYLIANQEEHLQREKKDKIVQAQIVRRIPVPAPEGGKEAPARKPPAAAAPFYEINQEELDKKIEAALSEDLTK